MLRILLCAAALFGSWPALADESSVGQFVLRDATVRSGAARRVVEALSGARTLQQIADDLNARFLLPRDIGLRLLQCDEPNAFYDADTTEIQVCTEIIADMARVLRPQFDDASDFSEALAGAFLSTVLHETGHALADVLELPITGREEDAADQFSAWLMIDAGKAPAVLGAAASYYLEDDGREDEGSDTEDLAGEHSLDRQRYFNHVCWVYGSAPDEHAFLLESWELPHARADQCVDEYRLLGRSWSRLLSTHLRRDPLSMALSLPRGLEAIARFRGRQRHPGR